MAAEVPSRTAVFWPVIAHLYPTSLVTHIPSEELSECVCAFLASDQFSQRELHTQQRVPGFRFKDAVEDAAA